MRRKNTRRFDPRYFMDEKTDKPKPKVIKEAAEETDWTRVTDLGAKPSSHPDKEEIVQKCWHETKHLDLKSGKFATAFNACMEAALSPMAENHRLLEITESTPWAAVNLGIQEAMNALSEEPPNAGEAYDILYKLLISP